MNLSDLHTIHFLGIGGIGMSALARYFHRAGKQVTGYDRTESVVTRQLVREGVEVYFEAQPERVSMADLIIYTPAIPSEHTELVAARSQKKPLYKRAEMLGLISQNYRTLAVAGTHGKTTTSTMLAWLLKQAGISVTAFLGDFLPTWEETSYMGIRPGWWWKQMSTIVLSCTYILSGP